MNISISGRIEADTKSAWFIMFIKSTSDLKNIHRASLTVFDATCDEAINKGLTFWRKNMQHCVKYKNDIDVNITIKDDLKVLIFIGKEGMQ